MNAPSVDVKDILEADSSLELTFSTNLFIGKAPVTPVDCVVIYDTPGWPPQLTLTPGENYYYPSIQIMVRANHYIKGWDLINDIKVSLHGRSHETWNGTLYTVIRCTSEPALLNWDEKNRAQFVVNFDLQRR